MSKAIPAVVVDDGAMYKAEAKVYPREVHGRFQRLRTLAVWVLLGIFYAFPWLRWDGRQAVLFDLPARKFYVFGLNFWPQDFFLLALLLIIAGLTLFFFTALAGRLWCGYACPQTVWTETFLWIERFFEGDRNKRMKLDAAPWSRDKLLRKGGKHLTWIVFALWTGFTFVGFFTPIRDLGARAWPFDWGGWETFWVLFYGAATLGNAGFLREQVCKYMCPYARFQSAMFDRNTLVIAYDEARGERRGPRKRGSVPSVLERREPGTGNGEQGVPASPALFSTISAVASEAAVAAPSSRGGDPGPQGADGEGGDNPRAEGAAHMVQAKQSLGDCIDCTICVQVCPTGIDIRDGLQYECIACGACIDACDSVMDRMGYPRGLIRYTTENSLAGKPTRILRARVWVYGALLLVLLAGFAVGVAGRNPLIVDVLRDRNALFREAADGTIENVYTLKIINKTQQPHRYRIAVEGNPAIRFAGEPPLVQAAAEEVLNVPVTLRAEAGSVQGRSDVRFVVEATDDSGIRYAEDTRFFGPFAPTQ